MNAQAAINCPFCLSEVPALATVCRHCANDLRLFTPLMAKISALEAMVQEGQSRTQAYESQLAELRASSGQVLSDHSQQGIAVESSGAEAALHPPDRQWPLWVAGLFTVMLLTLAHWVLIFVYDTPELVFRAVTFCIPVVLGFLASQRGRCFWMLSALVAFLTGIASVVAMLGLTHQIDKVPLWPANPREWRETFEYAVSIALALFTGRLAWAAHFRWRRAQLRAALPLLVRGPDGRIRINQLTSSLKDVATSLATAVSAFMALYSAVRSLLG